MNKLKKTLATLSVAGLLLTTTTATAKNLAKDLNPDNPKHKTEIQKKDFSKQTNPELVANFNDFANLQNPEGQTFEGGDGDNEDFGTKPENEEYTKFKEAFGDDPTFSIENGVLKVTGGNEKVQEAVNDFNNLTNQNLKNTTLNYIQQVMDDNNLQDREKRMLITSFIQASLGQKTRAFGDVDAKYKKAYIEITELAGKPAKVDKDGNVEMSDDDLFTDFTSDDVEQVNKALAEEEKKHAEVKKALAEEHKKLANQYIIMVNLNAEIRKRNEKTSDKDKIITDIATVNLYNHLLKNEPDYAQKMQQFNTNAIYLKKELNITEQEIQEEMKKLKR